jgi:hypothetical protein
MLIVARRAVIKTIQYMTSKDTMLIVALMAREEQNRMANITEIAIAIVMRCRRTTNFA